MASGLRILVVLCALIVAIPIGILAWLVSTSEGTAALWSVIESRVPEIQAEQISGSLRQGVQLDQFRFDTPNSTFSTDHALLVIDFTAIWSGKAIIDRLELGNLHYRSFDSNSVGPKAKRSWEFGAGHFLTEIAIRRFSILSCLYENTGWTARNTKGFARIHDHPENGNWVLDSHASTDFIAEKISGHFDLVSHGPFALITTTLTGESNAGDFQLKLETSNRPEQLEFTLEANLQHLRSEVLLDRNIGNYGLQLKAQGKPDQFAGTMSLRQLNPNQEQPVDHLAFLFSADSKYLHIKDLTASIRNKTVLRGNLQAGVSPWDLESANLAITGLNLHELHPDLLTTHVLGDINLQKGSQNTEVRLDLRDQNLGRLSGSIGITPTDADLVTLKFKSPAGSAEMSGRISFAGDQSFAIIAKARHFNPGRFIHDLDGDLSFSLEAKGTMKPLMIKSRLIVNPGSQLISEPLGGKMTFNLFPNGITSGTGKLSWGHSEIVLSSAGKSLNIRFDRINPKRLIENLNGEFSGNAHLVFEQHSTLIDLKLNAAEITHKNIVASNVSASMQGDTSKLQNINLQLRVDAIDIHPAGVRIEELELKGTPAQHQLQTEIVGGDTHASIFISGAYLSPAYRGTLDTFTIDTAGNRRFSLAQTAFFEARPNLINLGPLILKPVQTTAEFGPLELAFKFDLDQYRISSSGKLDAVPLLWLEALATDRMPNGNLSAQWNLVYDNSSTPLSGRLTASTSGLSVPLGKDRTGPYLNIDKATVLLVGHGKKATLKLAVEQNDRNRFKSELSAENLPGLQQLMMQNGALDTLYLAGKTSLTMDDLSAVGLVYPKLNSGSGQFDAKIRLFGTIEKPEIDGTAHLNNFEFSLPDTGLKATVSKAEALFDKQRVLLTQCDLVTPDTNGKATVTGNLSLIPEQLGHFSLNLEGSTLQIINTDRFKLILSPNLRLSGTAEKLAIRGKIAVDKGLFKDRSENQGVTLSPDVVIDDSSKVTGQHRSDGIGQGIQMEIDINIPDSFQVQSAGANVLLGGKLKVLQTKAGIPIADGRLSVVDDKLVKNTYSAYGQILRIKKGSVFFARSPINDPGLNILAVRDVRVGEVGVQVTGTLSAPEVRLESEPPMADSDILSWLVLGRPSSEAGKGFGALLLAASSEFTGSGSLIDQTRNWMGLDELSFDSQDDTTSGMVTFGKRIGDDLYLNYQQGILQQGYKIQAIYRLSPSWSAIGESGRESNAVEIEWKKRF